MISKSVNVSATLAQLFLEHSFSIVVGSDENALIILILTQTIVNLTHMDTLIRDVSFVHLSNQRKTQLKSWTMRVRMWMWMWMILDLSLDYSLEDI